MEQRGGKECEVTCYACRENFRLPNEAVELNTFF
jgi:hypothetical protein